MENLTKEMQTKLNLKQNEGSEEEFSEDFQFEGDDAVNNSDEELAAGNYHQYLRNKGGDEQKKRELKQWSSEEDDGLNEAYKILGANWKEVAKYLKGRTPTQCSQRWRRLHPIKLRNPWTEEEDQKLKDLVSQHGFRWQLIATFLTDRNGKQARERFINHLDPCINHEAWTEQEDLMLLEGFNQYGGKWSQISKLLPGRPENMIKNRFYSFIKKVYPSKLNKVYLTNYENSMEDVKTESYVNDLETLPDIQFDNCEGIKEENKMEQEIEPKNLRFYPNINEFNYDEFDKETHDDSLKNVMKMEYTILDNPGEHKICTLSFDRKKTDTFINPDELIDLGNVQREMSFGDELIFKKKDVKISYDTGNVETEDLYQIRDAVHTFKKCVDEEIDQRNSKFIIN